MVEIAYTEKNKIAVSGYYLDSSNPVIAIYDSYGRSKLFNSSVFRSNPLVADMIKNNIMPKKNSYMSVVNPPKKKNLTDTAKSFASSNKSDYTIDDFLADTNEDVFIDSDVVGVGHGYTVNGFYSPSADGGRIYSNLDPAMKAFVRAHEIEHRRRAYRGEPQDEHLVDAAAALQTGFQMGYRM